MQTFPGRDHHYDLAVVGAGIAGCEAALLAARASLDVLLVTTSLDSLYMLAHDHVRLEPPAGTLLSELRDRSVDSAGRIERWELHRTAKYVLEAQSGIHLLQSNVTSLIVEDGVVHGLRTWEGVERRAGVVALCVGSFLGARLVQGRLHEVAGRLGEMAYDELYRDLRGHGLGMEEVALEFAEPEAGPPYTVSCHRLSPAELASDGFRVARLGRLYAGGVCAHGPLDYMETARRGNLLGRVLTSALVEPNQAEER